MGLIWIFTITLIIRCWAGTTWRTWTVRRAWTWPWKTSSSSLSIRTSGLSATLGWRFWIMSVPAVWWCSAMFWWFGSSFFQSFWWIMPWLLWWFWPSFVWRVASTTFVLLTIVIIIMFFAWHFIQLDEL
jgi:hypothetical protein